MADVSLIFSLFARDQTGDGLGEAEGRFAKFQKGVAAASAAGAVAVGAFIKSGLDGVQEGIEAQTKLETAYKNTGAAAGVSVDQLNAQAEAFQEKTRFTFEDITAVQSFLIQQDAMQSKVAQSNKFVERATQAAADLATMQGVDGVAAAQQVAAAMAAPEKAAKKLLKLGIDLSAAEEKKIKAWVASGEAGKAQELILGKVEAKTRGAADAAGNTLAGKVDRAKNAFGEMQETLALALIPAMQRLTDWGLRLSKWAQDNPGKVKAVVIVLGSLWAIIVAVAVATKAWNAVQAVARGAALAWAGAQRVLNSSLLANPIGLVVLAIAGLVAAFVVAYKRSETFRNIVNAAFGAVRSVVVGAWDAIRAGASRVADWFSRIGNLASTIKDKAQAGMAGLAGIITAPYRAAFNAIASAWNNTVGRLSFSVPGWVPGLGGKGFSVPSIPMLAKGGTITGAGMAIVGEAGPELVSLGRGAQVTPLSGGGASVGGGRVVIDIRGGDDEMKRLFRKWVRIEGAGDVQAAFGR